MKKIKQTRYEVVWCDKNVLYVYPRVYNGVDVYPLELPSEIDKVARFVDAKKKPYMVYRLFNDGTLPSYCSHSNANRLKTTGFKHAETWLKGRGYKENKNASNR